MTGSKLYIWFTSTALQRHEADSAQVKELPQKAESGRYKNQYHLENRAARHSEAAESVEDRDSGFSLTDGYCEAVALNYIVKLIKTTSLVWPHNSLFCRVVKSKSEHTVKHIRDKTITRVCMQNVCEREGEDFSVKKRTEI